MLKRYRLIVTGRFWSVSHTAAYGWRWWLDYALRAGDELAPAAPARHYRRARLCSSPMILMPFA